MTVVKTISKSIKVAEVFFRCFLISQIINDAVLRWKLQTPTIKLALRENLSLIKVKTFNPPHKPLNASFGINLGDLKESFPSSAGVNEILTFRSDDDNGYENYNPSAHWFRNICAVGKRSRVDGYGARKWLPIECLPLFSPFISTKVVVVKRRLLSHANSYTTFIE